MPNKNQGFTLIELLVVIAVIGLLSSLVLVSLAGARAKARDARRKNDLDQIRTALVLYYDARGNWIETGSGCGWDGDGSGWFNKTDPPNHYPKSIVQCLIDAGFLSSPIIDPTGGTTTWWFTPPRGGYAYMKYHCPNLIPGAPTQVYLFAVLETGSYGNSATNNTCCDDCDERYGMNYYVKVQ